MPPHAGQNADPLIRKLEASIGLDEAEREALRRLPIQPAALKARQDIVREGDRPSRCFVLLEGVTCAYKVLGESRRQIMAFHLQGDSPDLQSLHLHTLDNSLATITPCRVGFIAHEPLRELCAKFPRIAAALWRETLLEAAIFRAWMSSIGRREAPGRIAHLFCEIHLKSAAVGLAEANSCPFPITQEEMADALGLSTVHVNRTLQDLRAAGLIALSRGVLTLLDQKGVERLAEFDPTYLHLDRAA
jgi:CRP-like cAMP-binding protein